MNRFLFGLSLLLLQFSAYADVAAEAPPETSGVTGFVVFSIIFVAICVGFVWMVVRSEKKDKGKQSHD